MASAIATLRGGLPDRYLKPEDLVDLFQLDSVETVYACLLYTPAFRVGKHLRYDPAAVSAWAEQRMADDEAA